MKVIAITQGRNIPLKGAASREVQALPLPAEVIVPFFEFRERQFRMVVKEGDRVLVGAALAEQREDARVILVSPVSGTVKSVDRGDKRALLSVTISSDGKQESVSHPVISAATAVELSREAVMARLMQGGVWPFLRQRPFTKIADPGVTPKAIFVRAMNTDPLAPSMEVLLGDAGTDFQTGLDILRRLTPGSVYLCFAADSTLKVLTAARDVECVGFSGPHPAGNVGTHIHHCAPLDKGEAVWFIEAQDVMRVARVFTRGSFDPVKVVAVTGEGAARRQHVRTIVGAPVAHILGETARQGFRYISGSVLSGTETAYAGALGVYDSQLTIIPAGGKSQFLGWLMPMFKEYSFSRTVAAKLVPEPSEVSLDTQVHGGLRAVVVNDLYDELNALDVMTYFLIKAIHAGQIEEMFDLGILECAAEDFALATFACPSKVDVGGIIQKGLDLIEKDG